MIDPHVPQLQDFPGWVVGDGEFSYEQLEHVVLIDRWLAPWMARGED